MHVTVERSFRIVMFCPQLRPAIGGAERQAERLAKGFLAHSHRVTSYGGPARLSELGRTHVSECYAIDAVATRYTALCHTLIRGAPTP